MRIMRYLVVAAWLSACASAKNDEAPPTPAKEIVSGGARIRGGGMRMDVQLGRPLVTRPASSGSVTAKPNAVVTP